MLSKDDNQVIVPNKASDLIPTVAKPYIIAGNGLDQVNILNIVLCGIFSN